MRYGREISAAVDPLDLGWPAVAVRAGVGLVYSVLIEEVVTPRSVGGRTGANSLCVESPRLAQLSLLNVALLTSDF